MRTGPWKIIAHVPAADFTHLPRRERKQIPSSEQCLPADLGRAPGSSSPINARLDPLLPEPGLADDSQRLAAMKCVREIGDGLHITRSMSSRIWACTVTSRAVVGSSAMSTEGLLTSAIAIIARCRIPPENWWG